MRVITVPTEVLMEMVLLQLEKGGKANLTVTGSSMLPMLREHQDSVTLVPLKEDLKPGDIALYRSENGKYILHRLIRKKADQYIFCGDNQVQTEAVSKEQLLAVVSEYAKKGKSCKLTSLSYRFYRLLWVKLFCLRKYYIALRRKLGRIRRKNQEE